MGVSIGVGQIVNRFLGLFRLELKYKSADYEDKLFLKLVKMTEGNTLLSVQRLMMIYQFCKSTSKLRGDIAECGVYKGGSAKLIAHTARRYGPQKKVFLLDTFGGMPKTDPDKDWHKEGDFKDTSIEAVKTYLTGYDNVVLLKGLFKDSFSNIRSRRFSFVHIDADIYSAVKECCGFFFPKLAKGGVIIVDDYGTPTCPGAKKAVDEFMESVDEELIYLPTGQCVIRKVC